MSGSLSRRILVVEDEFLIATEIVLILEDAGHGVIGPVASVEAANDLLQGETPDFAIVDANLRGTTSAPLVQTLRELGIPFCVCTGYQATDLLSGFGDVQTIQKPVTTPKLLSAIESLIGR